MNSIEQDFDGIYKEHSPKVFRLCMGYAQGDTDQARDWLQETFIKVWNHRKSFKGDAALSTWIYRIALNTCLSTLRAKKHKHLPLNEIPATLTAYNDELADSNHRSSINDLYRCINLLTHHNKALIFMQLEQIPQETIAATAGLKHGALRTRLNRIRQSLLKCLNHGK